MVIQTKQTKVLPELNSASTKPRLKSFLLLVDSTYKEICSNFELSKSGGRGYVIGIIICFVTKHTLRLQENPTREQT